MHKEKDSKRKLLFKIYRAHKKESEKNLFQIKNNIKHPMTKIGLVLSGGGIRGIAHLGLLKALDEIGVKPGAISGVSAGAIIGALYASGLKPDEILEIGKKQINFGFSNLLWRRGGLFSKEFIHKLLVEYLPHNSFERLQIPLIVNATDFTKVESVYFSKGELIPCLEASASVPILFTPANFEEKMLIDGGLLNNFPVEPLIGMCDRLIGCHVNKLKEHNHAGKGLSRMATLERCYHITISTSVYSKAHYCDIFIEPALAGYGMLDTKKADAIFRKGYEATMEVRDRILKLMGGS